MTKFHDMPTLIRDLQAREGWTDETLLTILIDVLQGYLPVEEQERVLQALDDLAAEEEDPDGAEPLP